MKASEVATIQVRSLRAYMVCEGDPGDGAALVLAFTAREAKKIGALEVSDWGDGRWTDLRVTWLRDADLSYLVTQNPGNGGRLCNTRPLSCDSCEQWHPRALIDGRCDECHVEARKVIQ